MTILCVSSTMLFFFNRVVYCLPCRIATHPASAATCSGDPPVHTHPFPIGLDVNHGVSQNRTVKDIRLAGVAR